MRARGGRAGADAHIIETFHRPQWGEDASLPAARSGAPVGEALQRPERFLADVVLEALRVRSGRVRTYAEGDEESHDDLVAALGPRGEGFPAAREEDRAVGARCDQALALEARERADDGDVRDTQAAGKVHDACFAAGLDEVGDGLGVVLGGLGRVGPACEAVAGRLFVGGGTLRSSAAGCL